MNRLVCDSCLLQVGERGEFQNTSAIFVQGLGLFSSYAISRGIIWSVFTYQICDKQTLRGEPNFDKHFKYKVPIEISHLFFIYL